MPKALISMLLALLIGWSTPLWALECREMKFEGNVYATCQADMVQDDVRLFLYDNSGRPFGHFGALESALAGEGKRLLAAMNGGMYHDDRSPVGHYLENGRQFRRVIRSAGPGNFGLLPNGVLCIGKDGRARVRETQAFVEGGYDCRYATQSGPMLVIGGDLHPAFLPDSASRRIRNGVGTTADGRNLFMVISSNPVTFHEFARFFRDRLALPDALYLEGRVSRLFARSLHRNDPGPPMGPILAVVGD